MLQRLAEGLEVHAQGDLTRPIARTLGVLRGCEHTECARIADVRARRRKVRVVQHIGKRGFEAYLHSLRNLKVLRQSQRSRGRTRSLQNADTRIAKPPRASRSRRKRRWIEVLRARLTLIEASRNNIRPQCRTAVGHVEHVRD